MREPLSSRLLVALTLGFVAMSGACGTNDPVVATCSLYEVPSTFVASTPTVSFENDIYPILQSSCQRSSCHGSVNNSQAALFLGTAGGGWDTAYGNLVGVSATNYPSMKRVAAGDPASSYAMHKLDGDSCTLPSCTGVCQDSMPNDLPPGRAELLPVDQRDTIRRWIAQGAPNN